MVSGICRAAAASRLMNYLAAVWNPQHQHHYDQFSLCAGQSHRLISSLHQYSSHACDSSPYAQSAQPVDHTPLLCATEQI